MMLVVDGSGGDTCEEKEESGDDYGDVDDSDNDEEDHQQRHRPLTSYFRR